MLLGYGLQNMVSLVGAITVTAMTFYLPFVLHFKIFMWNRLPSLEGLGGSLDKGTGGTHRCAPRLWLCFPVPRRQVQRTRGRG